MKYRPQFLSPLIVASTIAAVGCGTLHRGAKFTSVGAADPRADAQVKDRFNEARGEPLSADAERVVVLIDTVPDGISLKDGVLRVEEGYEHQVIGKFELTPEHGFFPPYREGWRKGFCHPQQVLIIGTLFMWAIVPTYYPCWPKTGVPKADMVDYFKMIGHAAGGDMVIASYNAEDQDTAAEGVGFVIKSDPRLSRGVAPSDDDDEDEDDEEGEGQEL
ncbi:MAG: hypothetical protein GX607_03270 [Myxococcales bacterium]|nr:hypothetical protein [Myxococcales bacterium]